MAKRRLAGEHAQRLDAGVGFDWDVQAQGVLEVRQGAHEPRRVEFFGIDAGTQAGAGNSRARNDGR